MSHAVTLVCSASGGALSPGARSWALQPAVEDRAGVLCPLCASRVLPDRGSRRDENATAAALLSSTLRRRGRGPQHRGQHGARVTAACRAWAPADSSRHGRHREQEAWPYTGGGSLRRPRPPRAQRPQAREPCGGAAPRGGTGPRERTEAVPQNHGPQSRRGTPCPCGACSWSKDPHTARRGWSWAAGAVPGLPVCRCACAPHALLPPRSREAAV